MQVKGSLSMPATHKARPIFVFGALRSGTPVFRLMLNAHDEISNPGEADYLFDFLARDGSGNWAYDLPRLRESRIFLASRLTIPEGLDGLALLDDFLAQLQVRGDGAFTLNIHRGIGHIAEILPECKVIHMLRDPRDVAQSSIGMGWAGNTYYGIDHWIRTEQEWMDAAPKLNPETVMELRYEALFRDIEAELNRVCAFVGVPFNPAMLDYHLSTTYGPPDVKLVEQWKRKAAPRELSLLEGKLGALLAARGFAPSGHTPAKPSAAEGFSLFRDNKSKKFRWSVKSHGFSTVVLEKLTRWAGLHSLNQIYRRRINSIVAQTVK
jgi:hypothetical protein